MSVLLLVAGVLIVVVALFDAAWTTVATASGAGPISRRLAPWLWGRALAGIPTVDDATYAEAAPASEAQRRLLAALLGEDGWPASA